MQPLLNFLIADNHVLFRLGLKVDLSELSVSCTVVAAANGSEALGLQQEWDLVTLDIGMPAVDGITVLRRI